LFVAASCCTLLLLKQHANAASAIAMASWSKECSKLSAVTFFMLRNKSVAIASLELSQRQWLQHELPTTAYETAKAMRWEPSLLIARTDATTHIQAQLRPPFYVRGCK